MAKPWAKLEQNYINHPKFLALTANAICLWLEGKNYCDMHHTDGMIPRQALKTFRWHSAKGIELLTRSCGEKPNRELYAPLWEALEIGGVKYLRMHDYLNHNDCRDEVLQRLEDAEDVAELRREANRERQRKFRADRKALLERNKSNALRNATEDVTSHTPTETVLETVTTPKDQSVTRVSPPPSDDVAMRAGALVDRYSELFYEHRRGARLMRRPVLDYDKALGLVTTWPDDERLEKLAVLVLTTDDEWISRTDRGFGIFAAKASWADDRLAAWEADQQRTA